MKTFYTITAVNTEFCNDRSKRYDSYEDALAAASARIKNGRAHHGVIVMKTVSLVTPKLTSQHPDVNVQNIT